MKIIYGEGKAYHIEYAEVGGGPQNESYTIRARDGAKVWSIFNPARIEQDELKRLCDLLNDLYEQIPQG